MKEPKFAFAGPCPVCKQNNVLVYDDGSAECQTVTEHAGVSDDHKLVRYQTRCQWTSKKVKFDDRTSP